MKTKHYQSELALLVGDDLPEAETVEVYRHLATCPDCRAHLQKLKQSQGPLIEYASQTAEIPTVDLRARVQKSLPTPAQLQRRHRLLHNWAPAATVVVACTLLFMVMGQNQEPTPESNGPASVSMRSTIVPSDRMSNVTFDPEVFDQHATSKEKMQRNLRFQPRQLNFREDDRQLYLINRDDLLE